MIFVFICVVGLDCAIWSTWWT